MADFLHFFDINNGIKISAVSNNNGNLLSSKVFKTESSTEASGLNSVYDNRFPANSGIGGDANTLNAHPGYWYRDRQNHSGAITTATDAITLNTKSGHYYLDRGNHSGLVNASQLNSLSGHYYLDRSNHSGLVNASQLNSLSGHYYLDRSNHSGNYNSQSVYFSGISYTISSGLDYNNSYRSGTYIVDWRQANLQTITLSGNTTLTFSGAMNGSRLQLLINQDIIGSRTITWPSSVKWPAATSPTLTTTLSGIDIVTFYANNNVYYGSYALDFR